MKQKKHKIFWRTGQEITPETFKQADNYMIGQHNLIRRLIADGNYGLLPQTETDASPFNVKTTLNNRELSIEQIVCSGTTAAGYLVEMESPMLNSCPQRYLSIPDTATKALYVVLRINPFEQVLFEPVKDEEAPAAHAVYELHIRELDRIGEDELTLLKVDIGNNMPVINPNYIPPCMSINACSRLLETFNELKQLLNEIMSHIEQKGLLVGTTLYPLTMLYDELDDFPLSTPPIVLIRLIKKIIQTCRTFISDLRTLELPDLLRGYNHNDMSITFKSLLSYLQKVAKIVGEGEEDFTPRI